MSGADLRDFRQRWPTLKPPLRPHRSACAAIRTLLPDDSRPVLLLGVTPELAALPERLVAMDWDAGIAAIAWPGDSEHRKLVLADWRTLPLADGSLGAVIGDASLSMLATPGDLTALVTRLARATGPGGRAIIRCLASPEQPESLDTLRTLALGGNTPFHEWKMRFNMAVAERDGVYSVTSAALFDAFTALFPARQAVAAASGWSLATIGEIDAYRGSRYAHAYPSRSRLMALLPDCCNGARFLPSGDYPGSAHCPLLVIEFA